MASVNISLADPMRDWVRERIASGDYATAGDYVRDLIRRDQADGERTRALIDALVVGEQSGISERHVSDVLAAIREDMNERP